ncbi:hypothetical protein Rhe02_54290 [Rhizocola hellebori]|uniref:HNH endonuclease n=1 Tax=Rhizocola hellebori TaxID=1392758 RepID=A0A8J3VIG2_9ACTN|nr:hypothetical protein [Rhizocola hellebori]GIH07362.1 hypothetical protein Rhe02_54290 [Rhizocola hellebori]
MKRGTGLAPMSAKRRAQLAAEGNPFPTSTFKAKPKMATAKRPHAGFAPEVVDAILERDGHACGRCGGALYGERGFDYSIQHRRARGAGGTQQPDTNAPQNGLALCGSGAGDAGCHSHVESHREEAREHGWAIRQDEDPLRVPVTHFLHGVVFLYSNGSWGSRPEVTA